jgi:hypothetical protein
MLDEAASSFILKKNQDGLWKGLMKSTARGAYQREKVDHPDRMTLSVAVL